MVTIEFIWYWFVAGLFAQAVGMTLMARSIGSGTYYRIASLPVMLIACSFFALSVARDAVFVFAFGAMFGTVFFGAFWFGVTHPMQIAKPRQPGKPVSDL